MATFVLVPGGWQGGWAFDAVAAGLRAQGHTVHTLTLAGLDDTPRPDANLATHVAQVVDALRAVGDEVVLAGHSYAGMVITGAADAVPERVRALVYIDAYVPEDGESTWVLTTDRFRALFAAGASVDGLTCAPPAGMDARCRPHPMGCFLQAIRLTGRWREVPRKTYVGAQGWAGSPFLSLYERLQQDGGWTTRALDCPHNVARHAPQALVDILLETLRP